MNQRLGEWVGRSQGAWLDDVQMMEHSHWLMEFQSYNIILIRTQKLMMAEIQYVMYPWLQPTVP